MRARTAVVLCLALALAACSAPRDGLVIFAASSLGEVLATLEPAARVNAAGSETLAAQLREGAPADVFASASRAPADALAGEGLIESPVAFARNRIVAIVPAANPARIAVLSDLRRPGVRVVAGAPGVPVGRYTRTILEALDATDITRNIVSEEPQASSVAGKVAAGEADAGFVYATDARPLGERVRVIELPPSPVEIVAVVAVTARARDRAAARAFVRRLLGDEGRSALTAAGFALP